MRSAKVALDSRFAMNLNVARIHMRLLSPRHVLNRKQKGQNQEGHLDTYVHSHFCVYSCWMRDESGREGRKMKCPWSLHRLLLRCRAKSRLLIIKVDNSARSFLVYYNCGGDCFFARVARLVEIPLRRANTLFIFMGLPFPFPSPRLCDLLSSFLFVDSRAP